MGVSFTSSNLFNYIFPKIIDQEDFLDELSSVRTTYKKAFKELIVAAVLSIQVYFHALFIENRKKDQGQLRYRHLQPQLQKTIHHYNYYKISIPGFRP
jgi:hypothetical protein